MLVKAKKIAIPTNDIQEALINVIREEGSDGAPKI
jgi:hypothetical protein